MGLSPLELELLLDDGLKEVRNFYDANPHFLEETPAEERGNYFWQRNFLDRCKAVSGRIPKNQHLETPQIIVEPAVGGYTAEYNPKINRKILKKLAEFKRPEGEKKCPLENIFSLKFMKDRDWIIEQQKKIVSYLCDNQEEYLQTRSPLDLKSITQGDVAKYIGHSSSSVSRLVKNLSVQLPDGRIIFIDELTPGKKTSSQKGIYALKKLQEDPNFYEGGNWKISDRELIPFLNDRFGINLARRTINKYKSILN